MTLQMQTSQETEHPVSRRAFIKGVIATGAAVSTSAYLFRGPAVLGGEYGVTARMEDDGPARHAARAEPPGETEPLELPRGAPLGVASLPGDDEEPDRHGPGIGPVRLGVSPATDKAAAVRSRAATVMTQPRLIH